MSWTNSCFRCIARSVACGSWITVVMLTGCVTRHYELEMKPAGGDLQRKLTASAQHSENDEKRALDNEELARIAAAYETDVPRGRGPEHVFSNVFSNQTPNDLGGAGTFTRWTTSLGSAFTYLERVRGDDDIVARLEQRRKAADRLVDLLIGWSEIELAKTPELPKVREFLDTTFRRDLVNLGIYSEATDIVDVERAMQEREDSSRENGELEIVARMIQYCVEREYVTPRQLPEWDYAIDQANQERPTLLIQLVQRALASKIGVSANQPIPASLTRWATFSDLEGALGTFIRGTEEYRKLKTQWEQSPAEHRSDEPPDPNDVMSDLAAAALFPHGLFSGGDRLTATMNANSKPIATNGHWNSETQRVEWKLSIEGQRAEGASGLLPGLMYALWTEPAVESQTELFGKIVLADESLYKYCLWRQGLPAEKARRWDEFLETVKPGSDLADRIRDFRFSDEAADTETRSETIRDLIADELQ